LFGLIADIQSNGANIKRHPQDNYSISADEIICRS